MRRVLVIGIGIAFLGTLWGTPVHAAQTTPQAPSIAVMTFPAFDWEGFRDRPDLAAVYQTMEQSALSNVPLWHHRYDVIPSGRWVDLARMHLQVAIGGSAPVLRSHGISAENVEDLKAVVVVNGNILHPKTTTVQVSWDVPMTLARIGGSAIAGAVWSDSRRVAEERGVQMLFGSIGMLPHEEQFAMPRDFKS